MDFPQHNLPKKKISCTFDLSYSKQMFTVEFLAQNEVKPLFLHLNAIIFSKCITFTEH